jgi:hypothetical protein
VHRVSTFVGVLFETEGLCGVACGLEEGFKMGGTKDLGQTGLVLGDPVGRGQGSRRFVQAFAGHVLLADNDDHAGEQTLDNVKDIANGSVVAESGECRAMEDHLPLDSTLGGKEGGSVYRNLDAQGRGARQTAGRLERAGTLDGKQHAGVGEGHVVPAVLFGEVGLEPEEPPVGAGVGGAESVCAGEGDAGPGGPVVHALYAAGEEDDGGSGVGHGGWGGGDEGGGQGRGGRGGPGKRRGT